MGFTIIPNEQTPNNSNFFGDAADYIKTHKETLDGFLEYAKTQQRAVGLAANQVALDGKRLDVRAFALLDLKTKEWSLVISPVIIKHLGFKEIKAEGCLTWKNKVIVAERYRGVEVVYFDMDGKSHTKIVSGFESQIWQHEINHLNGVAEDVRIEFTEPKPIDVGRNELCPCNSGKKYKKCCLLLK